MELRTDLDGNNLVLMPRGRIDDRSATELATSLATEMDASNEPRTVVDMAGVVYISAAGLRALLAAVEKATANGVQTVLCNLRQPIRETFGVSGFDQVLDVRTTREDALLPVDDEPATTDADEQSA